MQNKIFVFLIAGILFISLLSFAMAENASLNATINQIKEKINESREKIKEIRQNISEIKQNWTDYKEQVKQQVKEQRMTFVSCVSDSAKVKNDCLNAANTKGAACRIEAINNSDKNMSKQCISEYKDAKAECMKGFKETKTECNQAKHNFFDSLRVMFK
jgi:chromosome segregation ATPase